MPHGPLGNSDELLCQPQVSNTFATVSQSDLSWTEKVCAMAARRDGTLQVGPGLGKYPNRNVMDGYAAVARGHENWVVRATRALAPEFDETSIGPISYEVSSQCSESRLSCAGNAEQWIFL